MGGVSIARHVVEASVGFRLGPLGYPGLLKASAKLVDQLYFL